MGGAAFAVQAPKGFFFCGGVFADFLHRYADFAAGDRCTRSTGPDGQAIRGGRQFRYINEAANEVRNITFRLFP